MSEDRGRLRISNADRDEAVALLKRALDEGRLELSEFDERTRAVYGAKTNAELDLVFDDLPFGRTDDRSPSTFDAPADDRAEREQDGHGHVHHRHGHRGLPSSLHGLVWVAVPTITIWLLSSIVSGEVQYFWPAWPVGIMAAIFLAQWLTGDRDDGC
ncbi:DUF1707 SHOCT-like domain-containing protein [Glycomyces halotolerans]